MAAEKRMSAARSFIHQVSGLGMSSMRSMKSAHTKFEDEEPENEEKPSAKRHSTSSVTSTHLQMEPESLHEAETEGDDSKQIPQEKESETMHSTSSVTSTHLQVEPESLQDSSNLRKTSFAGDVIKQTQQDPEKQLSGEVRRRKSSESLGFPGVSFTQASEVDQDAPGEAGECVSPSKRKDPKDPTWHGSRRLFACTSCFVLLVSIVVLLVMYVPEFLSTSTSCAEDHYLDGTTCHMKLAVYSLSDAAIKCQTGFVHCGRCGNMTSGKGCPPGKLCVGGGMCKAEDHGLTASSGLIPAQNASQFWRKKASFALREYEILQGLMHHLDVNSDDILDEEEFCMDFWPRQSGIQTDQEESLLHLSFRSADADLSKTVTLEELFVFAEGQFQVFQWYFSLFKSRGGINMKPLFHAPTGDRTRHAEHIKGLPASLRQPLTSIESIMEAKENGNWFTVRHPELKGFTMLQFGIMSVARNHTSNGNQTSHGRKLFLDDIVAALGDTFEWFEGAAEDISAAIDDSVSWVEGAFEDTADWIENAWEGAILPFLNGMWDFIDDMFSDEEICHDFSPDFGMKTSSPKSSNFKPLPTGNSLARNVRFIKPSSAQTWGWWAWWLSQCKDKVVGFKQRVEPGEGDSGDDTSLNAVRFLCSDGAWISSLESHWGQWNDEDGEHEETCETCRCPVGSHVTGLRFKSEENQWWGDDTAANSIRPVCSDGTELIARKAGSGWEGVWGSWEKIECPSGFYVKGFRTRVEPMFSGDDTALNSIELVCVFDYGPERMAAIQNLRSAPRDTAPPRISGGQSFTIGVAGDPQMEYHTHDKDTNREYRNIIEKHTEDGIIMVGDLTNTADKTEYCFFAEVWYNSKTWPTTGNHDWMYGDATWCGGAWLQDLAGSVACYPSRLLSGKDMLVDRAQFMTWWMQRLFTDPQSVWPGFGGADSWSVDSLAYSFVKEGIRFVMLNDHPFQLWNWKVSGGIATQSIEFLENELIETLQPTVLVMHAPPVRDCSDYYTQLCANLERLENLLKGSQVVAIISGHYHQRRGIWDWRPNGKTVANMWGEKIKMMYPGAIGENRGENYPPSPDRTGFDYGWMKIAFSDCKLTFSTHLRDFPHSCSSGGIRDGDRKGWGTCASTYSVDVCGGSAPHMVCVDVQLFTKSWGYENGWELKVGLKSVCAQTPGHCGSNSMCSKRCCMPSYEVNHLSVILYDSNSDGWHGGYLLIQHQPFHFEEFTASKEFKSKEVCAITEEECRNIALHQGLELGDHEGGLDFAGDHRWLGCFNQTGQAFYGGLSTNVRASTSSICRPQVELDTPTDAVLISTRFMCSDDESMIFEESNVQVPAACEYLCEQRPGCGEFSFHFDSGCRYAKDGRGCGLTVNGCSDGACYFYSLKTTATTTLVGLCDTIGWGSPGEYGMSIRLSEYGIDSLAACFHVVCEPFPDCKYVSFSQTHGDGICAAFKNCDELKVDGYDTVVTAIKPQTTTTTTLSCLYAGHACSGDIIGEYSYDLQLCASKCNADTKCNCITWLHKSHSDPDSATACRLQTGTSHHDVANLAYSAITQNEILSEWAGRDACPKIEALPCLNEGYLCDGEAYESIPNEVQHEEYDDYYKCASRCKEQLGSCNCITWTPAYYENGVKVRPSRCGLHQKESHTDLKHMGSFAVTMSEWDARTACRTTTTTTTTLATTYTQIGDNGCYDSSGKHWSRYYIPSCDGACSVDYCKSACTSLANCIGFHIGRDVCDVFTTGVVTGSSAGMEIWASLYHETQGFASSPGDLFVGTDASNQGVFQCFRRERTILRLRNKVSTSYQWHMKGVELYSDKECTSKISYAGATARDLIRPSVWAPWLNIGGTPMSTFDSDPDSSNYLANHGFSCPANTCAFEVMLADKVDAQCVKLYQWEGSSNVHNSAEISVSDENDVEQFSCVGLSGGQWDTCIKTTTTTTTRVGLCRTLDFGNVGQMGYAIKDVPTLAECFDTACKPYPKCNYVSFSATHIPGVTICGAFTSCDVSNLLVTSYETFVTAAKTTTTTTMSAHMGLCSTVDFGNVGDMGYAIKGMTTLAECFDTACKPWKDCNYVSFSPRHDSRWSICGAFKTCDVSNLLVTSYETFATAYKGENEADFTKITGRGACTCNGQNPYNRNPATRSMSLAEANAACRSDIYCAGFTYSSTNIDFVRYAGSYVHGGDCGYGPPTKVTTYQSHSHFTCWRKEAIEYVGLCRPLGWGNKGDMNAAIRPNAYGITTLAECFETACKPFSNCHYASFSPTHGGGICGAFTADKCDPSNLYVKDYDTFRTATKTPTPTP